MTLRILLLWHEALGSDEEQATDEEIQARVLYFQNDGNNDTSPISSLHLVQGLLKFMRMLRRKDRCKMKTKWTPEWASVALTQNFLFVLEVEPQIFMAIGARPTVDIVRTYTDLGSDRTRGYEAVLREAYGMFRLFYGSVNGNLRLLSLAETGKTRAQSLQGADGMDVLLEIAALRKQLRKIQLRIDSSTHSTFAEEDQLSYENDMKKLKLEKQAAEVALKTLLAQSPASALQKKCAEFFPTLLQALNVSISSGLLDFQGFKYYPMDEPTFLAIQTFVNGFDTKTSDFDGSRKNRVQSFSLFFKGNLLWTTMDIATMQLLYDFCRIREERGMTVMRVDESLMGDNRKVDPAIATGFDPEIWTPRAYEHTFLPIWSSKQSYVEYDIVSQTDEGPLHQRKTARSLHKQHPVSISTYLSETLALSEVGDLLSSSNSPIVAGKFSLGSPSQFFATSTRIDGRQSNDPSPQTIKNAINARIQSTSFRNAGWLLKNGYFSKLLHANLDNSSERAWNKTNEVWCPNVFPLSESDPRGTQMMTSNHRVAVWHEANLTIMLLICLDESSVKSSDAILEDLLTSTFERLRDYFESQQRCRNLANFILTRYNATPSLKENVLNLPQPPPFLYINRVNFAFRMQNVPQLLKRKEDDMYPIPVQLLVHYFPVSVLALINEIHAELHRTSSAGNREICVRTRHAGWVFAKKSETSHRELYVFFDSKISSVYDLSDSLQMLLHDQFGNVLF